MASTKSSNFYRRFNNRVRLKSQKEFHAYEAWDQELECPAIIRVLPDYKIFDEQIYQNFLKQLKRVERAQDPDFPVLLNWVVDGKKLLIASPNGKNKNLKNLLEKRKLSLNELFILGEQLLDSLVSFHSENLIHGDIRPENVLIEFDNGEELKKATLLNPLALNLAIQFWNSDFLWGVPGYSAPEQAGLISAPIDNRSDLYSLGIVLYKAIVNRSPFGQTQTGETFKSQLSAAKPSWNGVSLPSAFKEIVERLMELDPENRYQSASSALSDFQKLHLLYISDNENAEFELGQMDNNGKLTTSKFIGRRQELKELDGYLDRFENGETGILKLSGPSGSGKTTLLRRFEEKCKEKKYKVLKAQGRDQNDQSPYDLLQCVVQYFQSKLQNPSFIPVFKEILGNRLEDFATAFPEFTDYLKKEQLKDKNEAPEEFGQFRIIEAFEALFDFLLEGNSEKVVLILDDIQWSDGFTLNFLEKWSRSKQTHGNLLIVLCYRNCEIQSDIDPDIISGWGEISVEAMSKHEVKNMLFSMAGSLPERVIQDIFTLSSGLPFMVGAILRGLVESGALKYINNEWTIIANPYSEMQSSSESARFLIKRVDLLDPFHKDVLSHAAVLGREFDLEDLSTLLGYEEDKVIEALKPAKKRQLIWINKNHNRATFFHDKIRESLLESLTISSRQSMHLQAAEMLEQKNPKNVYALSYHYHAAGRPDLALPYAIQAARKARQRYSLPLALMHYRIAEGGVKENTENLLKEEIEEELAEVLLKLGHYKESQQWYERLRCYTRNNLIRAKSTGKLGEICFKTGDLEKGAIQLKNALESVGVNIPKSKKTLIWFLTYEIIRQTAHTFLPFLFLHRKKRKMNELERLRCQLLSRLSYIFWFKEGVLYVFWSHFKELNDAELFYNSPELGQAYSEHSPAMTVIPWYSRSERYIKKALGVRSELKDYWGIGQTKHFESVLYYCTSQFNKCIKLCNESIKIMKRAGDQWEIVSAHWMIAHAKYRLGDFKGAIQEAKYTKEQADFLGDQPYGARALAVWSKASFGGVPLEELDAALEIVEPDKIAKIDILQGKAVSLLYKNRIHEAINTLELAQDIAEKYKFRHETVAPLYMWLVTGRRKMAQESLKFVDRKIFNDALFEARDAAKKALRFAKKFPNNLPHIWREIGIIQAMMGHPHRAKKYITRSAEIANDQKALYEYHLSQAWLRKISLERNEGFDEGLESLIWLENLKKEVGQEFKDEGTKKRLNLSIVDRYEKLIQLGEDLMQSESINDAAWFVYKGIEDLFRCQDILVFKVDKNLNIINLKGNLPSPEAQVFIKNSLLKEATQVAPDEIEEYWDESYQPPEYRSCLSAPIFVNGDLFGGIFVGHEGLEGVFGEEEIQLSKFICSLAGVAFERVMSVETLRNLNAELHSKVKALHESQNQLRQAKTQAETANRAKSSFLTTISHELRTPLNAIMGYAESVGPELPSQDLMKRKQRILSNSEKLLWLINEILDLSKAESGEIEIQEQETEVDKMLESTLSSVESLATNQGIDLQIKLESEVPRKVIIDPYRLEQILVNICGNAIKFTDSGGVTIKVSCDDIEGAKNGFKKGQLKIKVEDTGFGIPEDCQKNLFKPFYQARKDVSQARSGTGLGLSLSKKLAQLLGGDLQLLWSQEGAGSEFLITVLVTYDENEEKLTTWQENAAGTSEEVPVNKLQLSNIRALVAEDVDDNRELMRILLEGEGAQIKMVCNGEEAVEMAKNENFDVILMDVQMPVMNGYEATARIREFNQNTPIIAVTAHAMKEDQLQSQKSGCNAYISKPISREHTVKLIANLVDQQKETSTETMNSTLVDQSPLLNQPEFRQLALNLISKSDSQMSELERALSSGSYKDVAHLAHKYKGIYANFGFQRIADLVGQIEEQVNTTSPREEEVKDCMKQLKSICRATHERLVH